MNFREFMIRKQDRQNEIETKLKNLCLAILMLLENKKIFGVPTSPFTPYSRVVSRTQTKKDNGLVSLVADVLKIVII